MHPVYDSYIEVPVSRIPSWRMKPSFPFRKLVQDLFSKVTCILLNQTHEWGFISRLATTQRVGDTRSRLRCSLGQMFTPAQPITSHGITPTLLARWGKLMWECGLLPQSCHEVQWRFQRWSDASTSSTSFQCPTHMGYCLLRK
jgi:hypothetical protein